MSDIINKSDGKVPYILENRGHPTGADIGDELVAEVRETLRDHLKSILDNSSNAYKPTKDFQSPPFTPADSPAGHYDNKSENTPAIVAGGKSLHMEEFVSNETLSTLWDSDVRFPGFAADDPNGMVGLKFDQPPFDKTSKTKGLSQLLSGIKSVSATFEKDVKTPTDAPDIQKKISSILTNNRFHPGGDSPFIQGGEYGNPNGAFTAQNILGKYDKNLTVADLNGILKRLGTRLITKATGEDAGSDGKFVGQAFSVNGVQLGLTKVAAVDLTAEKQLRDLGVEIFNIPDTTLYNDDGDARRSYGQLNNPTEPFDSIIPLGMAVLVAEALIMAMLASLLFMLLPEQGKRQLPNPRLPNNLASGQFAELGAVSSGIMNIILNKVLGMPKLRNDIDDAFQRGILLFYGLPAGGDISVDTLSQASNILESAGYYATIMRVVIRDMEQIGKAWDEFGNLSKGDLLQGVAVLLKVFQAFGSSTTWKWMTIMMTTGDMAMQYMKGYTYWDTGTPSLDNLSDAPQYRGATSRGAAGQMTWRHGSAAALSLLPRSLGIASMAFAHSPRSRRVMLQRERNTLQLTPAKGAPARIPPEIVRGVEEMLDGEYLPFYFHDLRTNEIVSFHAFLGSLNESINPSYSSVDALGRVEPVRIYSSTTRQLNLSFWVAATSENSHERMWYDVNRLATMLYPQFSKGTMMINPQGQKFRMPFSQVMTASPLIRMRIGDLISSNGSRFGLARLFGIGEESFADSFNEGADRLKSLVGDFDGIQSLITAKVRTRQKEHGQQQIALYADIKTEMQAIADAGGHTGNIVKLFKGDAPGGPEKKAPDIFQVGDVVKAQGTLENDDIMWANGKDAWVDATSVGTMLGPGARFAITSGKTLAEPSIWMLFYTPFAQEDKRNILDGFMPDVAPYDLKYKRAKYEQPRAMGIYEAELLDADKYYSTQNGLVKEPKFADDNRFTLFISIGGDGDVSGEISNFALDLETMTTRDVKVGGKVFPSIQSQVHDKAIEAELIDPANLPANEKFLFASTQAAAASGNPIIRSFLATEGKGLAGFITSMQLDYNDSTWETQRSSGMSRSRAPIFTRIDMSFDVVHDIAPGLDADGAMRAPLWPVGNASAADWLEDYNNERSVQPAVKVEKE